MSEFDCDLVVIGLGPTGDVLAGLGALQGLKVIAIEREAAPFPLPRAAVFDHEIMRIFQMLGVAERIEPLCRIMQRYQFLTAGGETLLDFDVSQPSAISGWNATYALHQPAVEQALRQRLTELQVDVRLGTWFLRLAQEDAGVHVHTSAGVIRARYAVGCDGASSRVRETMGGGLFDYGFDEPWLVIDTIVDDPGDLPSIAMQICDPARPVTYIAMSPPRHRWEFMLKPGEAAEAIASEASIRALLAPWNCHDRLTFERKAIYRFHGLVAERWRHGRVLLAGDAAHQMPPFAGQGMCSGVRDAANLAWKLAAVVGGGADEALLDSYQAEREPHVRAIIETAIAMGKVVCMQDPAGAAHRDAEMLARKAAGEQDVQMDYPDLAGGCLTDTPGSGALFPQTMVDGRRFDDVLGAGPWLIGTGLAPADRPGLRTVDLSDARYGDFDPSLRRWLDRMGATAVLVRPDRHIFGTGDAGALAKAWAAALAGGTHGEA